MTVNNTILVLPNKTLSKNKKQFFSTNRFDEVLSQDDPLPINDNNMDPFKNSIGSINAGPKTPRPPVIFERVRRIDSS